MVDCAGRGRECLSCPALLCSAQLVYKMWRETVSYFYGIPRHRKLIKEPISLSLSLSLSVRQSPSARCLATSLAVDKSGMRFSLLFSCTCEPMNNLAEGRQGAHMHRTRLVFPLSSWLLATQKFPCAAAAAGGVDERRDGRSGASPMHYATEEANGRLRDQFVIVDPCLGARAGRTPSGRSERKTPPARSMILLGPNSGLDVPPSLSLSLCPLHCHYPCSPFLRNPTDLTPSWSCLGDAVPRLDGGPSRAMKFF